MNSRLAVFIAVLSALTAALLLIDSLRESPRRSPPQGASRVPASSGAPHDGLRSIDVVTETRTVTANAPVMEPIDSFNKAGVQLLSVADLAPASGSRWEIEAVGGSGSSLQHVLVADSNGQIRVAGGDWLLHSADGRWSALDSRVEVAPDQLSTVWVQRVATRRFRTVSELAGPVEGVRAIWTPRQVSSPLPAEVGIARMTAFSDESGLIQFENCPCEAGSVVFLHPDYDRSRLSLCGYSSYTVDVILKGTGSGRELRFTTADGMTPVTDVIVESGDGYTIARTEPGSASLTIPSWIEHDEQIIIRSPATHPSLLRLSSLTGNIVSLPTRRVASITIDDPTGCRDTVSVSVKSFGQSAAGLTVVPLLGAALLSVGASDTISVPLPLEEAIEVTANNRCGAVAEAVIEAGVEAPSRVLELQPTGSLYVHVIDDSGIPIPDALAATSFGEFTADESGVIRIPVTLELSVFTLHAEGHGPVVVSRNRVASTPEGVQDMEVVLPSVVRVTFVVRSRDGKPLPGMRVRAWHRGVSPDPVRSGEWMPGRQVRSISGVTDAAGRFVTREIAPGRTELKVDLPAELGSGEYLNSAYAALGGEYFIEADEEYVVVVPAPKRLSLEVVDGRSGNLVQGFELRGDTRATPSVLVSGGYWQGWISSDISSLEIVVGGIGSATFLPGGLAPGQPARVVVTSGPQALVRIEELPLGMEGTPLTAELMRATAEGLMSDRTLTIRTNQFGEGKLELTGHGEMWIGIADVDWQGETLRFEPKFQPIKAGAVTAFRCRVSHDSSRQ